MSDQKISLLINRQVPEFVREEYPLFITFLEAYYEYLETKQGTQLNDLVKKSKDLKYLNDVDYSIDDFEQQFFNTFASLVPRDVAADKNVLIKKILPLYLSKGSEASFKLLYRLLFGQELEITYPGNEILIASDGKWVVENVLKVSATIASYYTGTGSTKEFKILQEVDDITVYVNDVLQTNYYVKKELRKLTFNTAPANGATIKVYYNTLDYTKFVNRKVTGLTSGATALVEKTSSRYINSRKIVELFINSKTLIGEFNIGEKITATYIDSDDVLINILFSGVSSVQTINIIDGGSNYNVGDPVAISTGFSDENASATISKIFKGVINKVTINNGGAGFKPPSRIAAVGYANTELDFAISQVDTTGANTANVFTIFSDVISDIGSTLISAANYGTAGTIALPNVNTRLIDAFGNVSYTAIGSISNVAIISANVAVSIMPTLNAEPAIYTIPARGATPTSTDVKIDTFRSIGRIDINNGGTGYAIGDELVFTNQPMTFGYGAAAEVSNVSASGVITAIKILPSKISGNVSVTSASNVMVQGYGTAFNTELRVGDRVLIQGQGKTVIVIASATSLNVNSSFTSAFTNKPIRHIDRYLIGGQGYAQDRLPTITVTSTAGSGANISVHSIMGDGEDLSPKGTKRIGEIEEIIVVDPGSGYTANPLIDLTSKGDGNATANASLNPTYEVLDGRWTSADGILSSIDRKIQGKDYYVKYSYLTSSETEFAKYKQVFKELLHPAGFKAYAQLVKTNTITLNGDPVATSVDPNTIRSVSGTVNVGNTSIYVTGTGTLFNIANSLGIISVGAYIAVNSQIRVVSSIISNTNLAVTSAFTITANNEEMVVMNTVYDAVVTETLLEEIITETGISLTTEV
jgi:hypothetical protein